MKMIPRHDHDCLDCRFLGALDGPDAYRMNEPAEFDLYFCPRCDGGSVIARRSSEGSDYISTAIGILRTHPGSGHPALWWAVEVIESEERRNERAVHPR